MAGSASTRQSEVEDDDISITSTVEPKYDPDHEFEVDRILAEKREGRGNPTLFLIKWENYDLEESTWEPRSQISPAILDAWNERKLGEETGIYEKFDIAGFKAKVNKLAQEKQQRQKRRQAKRKKLGLILESSEDDADGDGWSSDEAVEDKGLEEGDYLPKRSRSKSRTPVKPAKKNPARFMVRGSHPERIDDHSSDTDVITSPKKKSGAKVSRPPAKFMGQSSVVAQSSLHSRTTSESSSDIPLTQKRQKLTTQGLSKLKIPPQSGSNVPPLNTDKRGGSKVDIGQRESAKSTPTPVSERRKSSTQVDRVSKSSSSSAQVSQQQGRSRVPSAKSSLFVPHNDSSESSPIERDANPRGRPSARGATRGGSAAGLASTRKNVFQTTGESTKARGRQLGQDYLTLASDTTKDPKIAPNMRSQNKLQKQGRNIAERAPDISAIGGLYNPNDMSAVPVVRPSNLLRKSSTALVAPQAQEDDNGDENVDYLFEEEEAPAPAPPAVIGAAPVRPTGKPVCFFWHIAETNPRAQGCANGYQCKFYHHYEPGARVADPPPNYVDVQGTNDIPSNIIGSSGLVSSPARLEQPIDSPLSVLSSARIVTQPWLSSAGNPTNGDMSTFSLTGSLATEHMERPPWDPLQSSHSICHFWRVSGKCIRGARCKFYHSNDKRLPLAPSPEEQMEIQSKIACPLWLQDRCYSDRCNFMHRMTPAVPEDRSRSMPMPKSNVSNDSSPVKKSVKFLDEPGDVFDEPSTISPITMPRNERQNRRPVCRFFLKNGCKHGSNCWNSHDVSHSRSGDVDMPDRPEDAKPVSSRSRSVRFSDINMDDRAEKNGPAPYDPTPVSPQFRAVQYNDGGVLGRPEENEPYESTPVKAPEQYGTQVHASTDSWMTEGRQEKPDGLQSTLEKTPTIGNSASKVTKKKVTMAEYSKKKAHQAINARGKRVFFGRDEKEAVILDFGDIQAAEDSSWKQEFPKVEKVTFDKICMAQDFAAQQGCLLRRSIAQGSLVPVDADNQRLLKFLEKVADELVLRSSGLLASFQSSCILVYPASKEEWKFLETPSDQSKGSLKYFVFEAGRDLSQSKSNNLGSLNTGSSYRRLMIKMIHGLDVKKILSQPKVTRNAFKIFMLFPRSATYTSDFIAAWLKEYSEKAEFYHSQTEGAWDYFRRNVDVGGIVLVHETAAASLHMLPHLFEVVSKHVDFWFISEGTKLYPLYPSQQYLVDESALGRITATRLFPQGCAMLLTPSFLVAEPKRAYEVMKKFMDKSPKATSGSWKVVCPRNIVDYLLHLAIGKANEKAMVEAQHEGLPTKDAALEKAGLSFANCEIRFKLHALFVRLETDGLIESPIGSGDADFTSHFPAEKEWLIVQAPMFIDPDDEPALIEYFAFWSMQNMDRHRRFIVIGTGPASAQRAKRIREDPIAEVDDSTNDSDSEVSDKVAGGTSNGSHLIFGQSSSHGGDVMPPMDFSNGFTDATKTALEIAARLVALHTGQSKPSVSAFSDAAQNHSTSGRNMLSVDQQSSAPTTEQRQFCARTGASGLDAKNFLAKANNDLERAIELFEQSNQDDLGAQIDELITTEAKRAAPLSIHTEENDPSRRVSDSPNVFSPNSPLAALPSARFEGTDSVFPPQFDGADDRPGSSGSTSSTRSGITTKENGQRVVARNLRPNGTFREEIAVRPGFVPVEDIDRYVSPGRVAANRAASRTQSFSPAPAVQDPDRMDIDSGNDSNAETAKDKEALAVKPTAGSGKSSTANGLSTKNENTQAETKGREIIFKPTTSWYEEYKKTNGNGWENIFLGSHEDAIKKSGLGLK